MKEMKIGFHSQRDLVPVKTKTDKVSLEIHKVMAEMIMETAHQNPCTKHGIPEHLEILNLSLGRKPNVRWVQIVLNSCCAAYSSQLERLLNDGEQQNRKAQCEKPKRSLRSPSGKAR